MSLPLWKIWVKVSWDDGWNPPRSVHWKHSKCIVGWSFFKRKSPILTIQQWFFHISHLSFLGAKMLFSQVQCVSPTWAISAAVLSEVSPASFFHWGGTETQNVLRRWFMEISMARFKKRIHFSCSIMLFSCVNGIWIGFDGTLPCWKVNVYLYYLSVYVYVHPYGILVCKNWAYAPNGNFKRQHDDQSANSDRFPSLMSKSHLVSQFFAG